MYECGLCAASVDYDYGDEGQLCGRCGQVYCHGCYIFHNLFGQHVEDNYVDDGEPSKDHATYVTFSDNRRRILRELGEELSIHLRRLVV